MSSPPTKPSPPPSNTTTTSNQKPPLDSHNHHNHNPTTSIVRIPLKLTSHILPIALAWSLVFTSSCLLPLIGYYTLHNLTTLKAEYVLSILTPIFGAVSLLSLIRRTLRLTSTPTSTKNCRPLGSHSAWFLDYFNWNFLLGFVVVSALIAAAIASKPSNVRIVSLPLSVLLLQVCGQMMILIPLRAFGVRAPFQVSSLRKGERLRPACYTIVEDVVAVDGGVNGFRELWKGRWDTSPHFRRFLGVMDVVWGVSGVCVAGGVFGVVFGVGETSVGWGVGWAVPWIWAGGMAVLTGWMVGGLRRREDEWERGGVEGKVGV